MSNPEHIPQSGERGLESIGNAARKRSQELSTSPESSTEQSPEKSAETLESARREVEKAQENVISVEKPHAETASNASDTHRVSPTATTRARKKAYEDIMYHTQAEMSPASRAFSKVIHQPIIEQVSTAVGSTVARPNAILFGALFAIIISGGIYLIARYYGYALSGFEAIGAFCIGWVVGMLVDFVRLALHKH